MNEENKINKTNEGDKKTTVPSVSLPKGGGAIRGIGEKFTANPVTGTGSLSIPIFTSPGRSGFGPQLSLTYDSGSGNGPFGFGWNLSLPSITRKTDKGLPKYQDKNESDIFILSGTEDLVPVLKQQGNYWISEDESIRTINNQTYKIKYYRPRIEGLFARIECWTNTQTNETYWRSISKDNVVTIYGRTSQSRIEDPDVSEGFPRVFSWLICESYDDKGNAVFYEYKPENSDGIDMVKPNEQNRTIKSRSVNRYIKRVKYGNKTPIIMDSNLPRESRENLSKRTDWLFEVVFDYEEGHCEELPADSEARCFINAYKNPIQDWKVRQDPFSSYRSGFELRTYRLCRRVLMFHHFPNELGLEDYLVRSTEFIYNESPIASFVTTVIQAGYKLQDNGTYLKKSFPPLEFEYSKASIQNKINHVDEKSLENLPQGLDATKYQWVDLDGEGISGILTEQAGSWFYKRNKSALPVAIGDGKPQVFARFAQMECLSSIPSFANLSRGSQQLLDLNGDGQLNVVEFNSPVPGFYKRTKEEDWHKFKPFESLPNISWNDPNMKFIDLTGDGHADIFITEDEAFTWYTSLEEKGFDSAKKVYQSLDEEKGPKLIFADSTQSIFLADFSGDGLTDLVRIRNNEVSYWPNLGYGKFGARVIMDNSPHFDAQDQFDQSRIRLADIDGSGVTDIIYLNDDSVSIYFNESGNSWTDNKKLNAFPKIDNLASIMVADLLGNGTACLVWSSPLPNETLRSLKYIDLMGGQKPYLLIKTINNLGAETHIHYAPSTKFYLADKESGKPWITKIPFPVHVVERVETYDHISRNRFVSRYAYHHGYFDGKECEFRGFGMVEQWDTEEYTALTEEGQLPIGINIDASSHIPPVLTRTFFHTGVFFDRNKVSDYFAGLTGDKDTGEYFREPGLDIIQARAMLLNDTLLPPGLTADEEAEACRALKGTMLRQEVYSLDGTDKSKYPYVVTEQNFVIRCLQPKQKNRHGVFFTYPCEAISYHYERNPADPRISHTLTLEVDAMGNVLKQASIGYGRRKTIRIIDTQGQVQEIPNPDLNQLKLDDKKKQTNLHITYNENNVTNRIDTDDTYRMPLPYESRIYELIGYNPTGLAGRFQISDFVQPDLNDPDGFKNIHIFDSEMNYEDEPTTGRQRRLIEHKRILYQSNNLTGALPLGKLESLALPFENYQLAFTPGLITKVYNGRVNNTLIENEGHYVHSEGDVNWWIPSGRVFYSPDKNDSAQIELDYARNNFFLPLRFLDPYGQTTTLQYDNYNLQTIETTDPLGNKVTAGERDVNNNIIPKIDYRVLQPFLISDPNGNRSEVAFDTLGMVAGTAIMGKVGENKGDSLAGFEADLTQNEIDFFFADPKGQIAKTLLNDSTTRIIYDESGYYRLKNIEKPIFAATIARETHASDPVPVQGLKLQVSFSYSDGFGRVIQQKVQAEPGLLDLADPNSTYADPRWVGSGWTIFNNKGKPVKQYEPFFDNTHDFKFGNKVGVSPVLFYDPVGRVVATLYPNHTYDKVIINPWIQETWDVNDTILQDDPKNDIDVGSYFKRIQDIDYLPTWYESRINGQKGNNEKTAAEKAAFHNATPSVVHFDSLGRTFLTIDDNGQKGKYETRVNMDIEGNTRSVIDAKDRTVMQYDYNLLGSLIREISMEAGERWVLNDITGNPIYNWDSREHQIHTTYDELQRPTGFYLRTNSNPEILVEKIVYGETLSNPEQFNHRNFVYQIFDGAGIVTNEKFDFKGNLIKGHRQLLKNYKNQVDWAQSPVLESEVFTSSTQFDALNRAVQITVPHSSQGNNNINIIQPVYNEANFLEMVDVWTEQNTEARTLLNPVTANLRAVKNIDYDAKGQRTYIEYGNNVSATYEYDPDSFHLTSLKTTRTNGGEHLQDIEYVYDPVGNITSIRDDTQQTVYFNNQVVMPYTEYQYDAIYQLEKAFGREHIGQQSAPETDWKDEFRVNLDHPNDGQKMCLYTEKYEYDKVGNILKMIHQTNNNGSWTRTYNYNESSLINPLNTNNRLSTTTVGNNTIKYKHDAHGNMIIMPHLPVMEWDFEDQLHVTEKQVVNNGNTSERTFYVYDAAGVRVRKVTERQNSTLKKERIYLDSFEIYRDYNEDGTAIKLERETLHIMDDSRRIALIEIKTIDINNDPSSAQLIRYQFGNHLGSASLEMDENAKIISYEEYYPYGSTSYQAVDKNIKAAAKRYRYTGKERDEETGLYYHGARYYACWLGRWTSADPIGIKTGLNLYIHTSNNPVLRIDLNGMWDCDPQISSCMPPPEISELLKQLENKQTLNEWAPPEPEEDDRPFFEKYPAPGTESMYPELQEEPELSRKELGKKRILDEWRYSEPEPELSQKELEEKCILDEWTPPPEPKSEPELEPELSQKELENKQTLNEWTPPEPEEDDRPFFEKYPAPEEDEIQLSCKKCPVKDEKYSAKQRPTNTDIIMSMLGPSAAILGGIVGGALVVGTSPFWGGVIIVAGVVGGFGWAYREIGSFLKP